MRKTLSFALVGVFVLSFAFGAVFTTVDAKPPLPATYKCINHDTYFCVMYPSGEVCTFEEYGCDLNMNCICKTISGQAAVICTYYSGLVDTTFQADGCPTPY